MGLIDDLPGGRNKPRPRPQSSEKPVEETKEWIDPGLLPGDPVLPQPDPEPEPEPQMGLILNESEDLLTKTGTYGGAGANCRSRSTNWNQMAEMPYWYSGNIEAGMNGNTLTLASSEDSWRGTDILTGTIAENSYVEMDISLTASGGTWGDFVETFSICLEGDDSISISIGTSIYDFSIIKNGVEVISSNFVAELNTLFSEFSLTITLTRAVHCSYTTPQDPDTWYEPHPGMPETEPETEPESQEGAIDDSDTPDGGSGGGALIEWTQEDSWVVLGLLVMVIVGYYILNTVREGSDGQG